MKNRRKRSVDEIKSLAYLFISLFVVLQIVFYKENILITFRTVSAAFILFIIPGYLIMYIWKDKFDLIERIVGGTAIGVTLTSLLSYFLTFFGLKIIFQVFLIPAILIITPLFMIKYISRKKR